MSDLKPVKVSGKLYWNKYLTEFNTHFNEANEKYECTLGQLSDAAVKALQGLGIKVKFKEEMGHFIVAKSKYIFKPVDPDGNDLDPKEFGNETEAYAVVSSYAHRMSKQHGNAPSIKKLVVTKVVKYEGSGDTAEAEETADDIL